MSTIASPRDPSGPFPRRTNSVITPTSSSRPSLDVPASASNSPNPNQSAGSISQSNKRANRAALREYYNLRSNNNNNNNNNKPLPSPPTVEITDHLGGASSPSLSSTNPAAPPSELDSPNFDAQTYVANLLASSSLADLLRTYTAVLAEMRALDAERKALVYDNYSKLIAATETIRRMRGAQASSDSASASGPGPGSGAGGGVGVGVGVGAASLEAVVEGIYRRAADLREELRASVAAQARAETLGGGSVRGGGDGDGDGDGDGEADEKAARRERTRELAREVVKVPGRLRRLVEDGKAEEAKREWEMPRRLLVRWKELGVGGDDVAALIEEGDAALREAVEADGNKGGDPTA
ncbi:Vps51/Vps67-domain-containing protein [Thermothelomyces heterothallicus CBS 202.75]|uniref:Vps51/Vps67-domain-containing protein n=1 Tax=Thermothelomyces heterothallicus CBS 202.75 TaxID=1149848 RepID=UPI0037446133